MNRVHSGFAMKNHALAKKTKLFLDKFKIKGF